MSYTNSGFIRCDICNSFIFWKPKVFELNTFENKLHACDDKCLKLFEDIKTPFDAVEILPKEGILHKYYSDYLQTILKG